MMGIQKLVIQLLEETVEDTAKRARNAIDGLDPLASVAVKSVGRSAVRLQLERDTAGEWQLGGTVKGTTGAVGGSVEGGRKSGNETTSLVDFSADVEITVEINRPQGAA